MQKEIQAYISTQSDSKKADMLGLHKFIQQQMPKCRLWFLDGKNGDGKVVSNPNIGYGYYTMKYTDGTTREFYQVGLSANTSGISVYVLGINDKTHLANTYGKTLGKASVSGYCIKFKKLSDINLDVLGAVIRDGVAQSGSHL